MESTKKWLRKSLVILITILTFGLVSPSSLTWFIQGHAQRGTHQDHPLSFSLKTENINQQEVFDRTKLIMEFKDKAEENAYQKFGERISPKIGEQFHSVIFPKIVEAIDEVTAQFPDSQLQNLAISEKPSGGRSEKIFHIYHSESGTDVIRFHVRQDLVPLEGYWFNFHYHTYQDSFLAHYDLGSIFWDTNTPPKWGQQKVLS